MRLQVLADWNAPWLTLAGAYGVRWLHLGISTRTDLCRLVGAAEGAFEVRKGIHAHAVLENRAQIVSNAPQKAAATLSTDHPLKPCKNVSHVLFHLV